MKLNTLSLSLGLSLSLVAFSSSCFAMFAEGNPEQDKHIVCTLLKADGVNANFYNTATHHYDLTWKTYPGTELEAQKQRVREVQYYQPAQSLGTHVSYTPIVHRNSGKDAVIANELMSGASVLRLNSVSNSSKFSENKEYSFGIFKANETNWDNWLTMLTIKTTPIKN